MCPALHSTWYMHCFTTHPSEEVASSLPIWQFHPCKTEGDNFPEVVQRSECDARIQSRSICSETRLWQLPSPAVSYQGAGLGAPHRGTPRADWPWVQTGGLAFLLPHCVTLPARHWGWLVSPKAALKLSMQFSLCLVIIPFLGIFINYSFLRPMPICICLLNIFKNFYLLINFHWKFFIIKTWETENLYN